MADTEDRVLARIPRRELDRRWNLVRDRLKKQNLEALVVLNSEDFLGGYYKWLTDRPANTAYHAGAIFHQGELMSVIEHGPEGERRASNGDDPDYPGVGEILTTAAFHSVNYTHAYEAKRFIEALQRRGYKRIAVAGKGAMPFEFARYLAENSKMELVDETDFIDNCKAVKSADELEEIKRTAQMQDAVFKKVLPQIKPGMRDMDVMALVQYEGRLMGSEQAVFLFGSAACGQPAGLKHPHYQARKLEKGDQMAILIENNGAGGFYTELGRTVVLGKAPTALLEACAQAVEAQQKTVVQLHPGRLCADIAKTHDDHMKTHKLPLEKRLYAHGQGYDLVERPLIRADETMALANGMNLAVHPTFATQEVFASICDNYLVTEKGPSACLHVTEKKIFELG